MKTFLVWYFITFGANGAIHWSPALLSLQECQRIQEIYKENSLGKVGRCVKISEAIK